MALSGERNTLERASVTMSLPMDAIKIWQGSIVALNASGFATKGAVATTLTARGRAEETVDNSGGSAGDKSILVKRGEFFFKNHGADPVVQADCGKTCYIVDDETVAHTNGTNTRSAAGEVTEVNANGVWVLFK